MISVHVHSLFRSTLNRMNMHRLFLKSALMPSQTWSRASPAAVGSQLTIRCYAGGTFKFKIRDVVEEWAKLLKDANVEDPRPSIEHIVAHALHQRKTSDVYRSSDKFLSSQQMDRIVRMCKLRLKKMPIQYVLGEWDFRNLTLKMREPVFIPRPETETLVEILSKQIGENTPSILELCCGSGAISLALLSAHEQLSATVVDMSPEACQLTKENAKLHDLYNRVKIIQKEVREDNVGNFLGDKFDIIICNPPYVPSQQMEDLQPEILRYEDLNALDGGKDGLNIIKLVLRVAGCSLNVGGKVFLEVDPSHPRMLEVWIEDNRDLGLSILAVHKDFLQCDRFVEIVKGN